MMKLGMVCLAFVLIAIPVALSSGAGLLSQEQLTEEVRVLRAELADLREVQREARDESSFSRDRPVAFTVRFSNTDQRNLNKGQVLKFDRVEYNAREGYNPSTGIFTAPSAGTYVFYTRVMRHYRLNGLIQTALYKGNTHIGDYADASNHDHDSGSTMVTVHLARGDKVSVRVWAGTALWGDHTSFTGFKL